MINTNNDYIFGYENALSVFDGMSCGQLALQRAGIKVENYFASEIDKYAMQVAKNNFPNTKFIGDVTKINYNNLPKADLLIGGSPCQGFSFAGKQLNFEDPRSKLFFEFVKARDKNPNADFLLENVKMKKEYQDVITSYLGVEPVEINSALVSAQNRKRLYWTNIGQFRQPEDKGLILSDVMDHSLPYTGKSYKLNTNPSGNGMNGKIHLTNTKSPCLTTNKGEGVKVSNGLIHIANALDINGHDILKRVYSPFGKAPTLNTCSGGNREVKVAQLGEGEYLLYRKLIPIECERLQTVPDNYTAGVSNSQRYKMLGNGWTIDVIKHILLSNPLI